MELQHFINEKQEREILSLLQSEMETAEGKVERNIKMHEFLIQDTLKNIGLDNGSTLKEYAEVVESNNPANDSSDKQERDALKEFCLIALWRLKDEQWRCYRMFKVENPAIMKYKIDRHTTQRQFIHVGSNNELFYFTKERKLESKVNYVCQILDTKMAMTCAESQLEHSSASYFTPPIQEKKFAIEESSKCYEMLDRMFDPETRYFARTLFQLYDFNKKVYLVLPW